MILHLRLRSWRRQNKLKYQGCVSYPGPYQQPVIYKEFIYSLTSDLSPLLIWLFPSLTYDILYFPLLYKGKSLT